jgi:Sigma-70 region 2
MALAAAFFRFFENDSSGETAAISDQSRRARRWPLGHYQHKRGNKMKHRCNVRKGDGTVTDQKSKPPMKAKSSRFDSLVARYYPAVYSFASRLTDDPRDAVELTRNAFRSVQKQLCSLRDQTAVATTLILAVIRAALAAG